ncbi:MAG: hypothetical protein JSU63_00370 [Phycisphaerales bacterium]|nr:MAG: hypothetical protein JSU63_00370 [Phycisphaerales bacterium]
MNAYQGRKCSGLITIVILGVLVFGVGADIATAQNPPGMPSDYTHRAPKHRFVSIDPSTNGPDEVALCLDLCGLNRCSNDLNQACVSDQDCWGGSCVEHADVGLS